MLGELVRISDDFDVAVFEMFRFRADSLEYQAVRVRGASAQKSAEVAEEAHDAETLVDDCNAWKDRRAVAEDILKKSLTCYITM